MQNCSINYLLLKITLQFERYAKFEESIVFLLWLNAQVHPFTDTRKPPCCTITQQGGSLYSYYIEIVSSAYFTSSLRLVPSL